MQREQVLALAPDTASIQAAQKLTAVAKWPTLGVADTVALWGECQGSGKTPYQTIIDLGELAFKCSCPSRKFPCKHALALLLLYTHADDTFAADISIPDWVQNWLDGRAKRKEAQAMAAAVTTARTTDATTDNNNQTDATANQAKNKTQERRTAARAEKVAAGIEELTIWLKDLVRGGFIEAQSRPYSYWQQMAARLIDAQALGLASQVEGLASTIVSGNGWEARLISALGRLFLLLEAYQRLESLPAQIQHDIRTLIGWHQSREEVLAGEAIPGQWAVMSHSLEQAENLYSQRVWLQHTTNGRYALILNFAHAGNRQTLDTFWQVGTVVDATIYYYGGTVPLRALATAVAAVAPLSSMIHTDSIGNALAAYRQGMTQNPWLTRFPLALTNVAVALEQPGNADTPFVYDQAQHQLPLSKRAKTLWQLLSITGGHPVQLFGEWLDDGLLPLGLWHEGRYWTL
ncbi:MAG: SWIM zinc finger family protein [Caldilineaceae bacterium]